MVFFSVIVLFPLLGPDTFFNIFKISDTLSLCISLRVKDGFHTQTKPHAGRSHEIKIDNSSFERAEQFKYLGTTLTNPNSFQEEIKSRLKLGNACYHWVQNLLSPSLPSKNIKIKIYRTIILPVVYHGCETWLLTLMDEHKLRVFENRMLRRIFGPIRDAVTGEWR